MIIYSYLDDTMESTENTTFAEWITSTLKVPPPHETIMYEGSGGGSGVDGKFATFKELHSLSVLIASEDSEDIRLRRELTQTDDEDYKSKN